MGDIVLSEKVMSLSLDSVILSAQAYSWRPWARGFAPIKNYRKEPDQAVLTEKDGYCYVAFRGTVYSVADWSENLRLGKKPVCGIGGSSEDCCDVRSGFYDAYFTTYFQEMEEELQKCVEKCTNKDECLVVSGHSQGGAIAAVAGIRYSEYNPYVITFGEPPSVDPGCKVITSDRWYRYVNTKVSNKDNAGIEYDPVPFSPGFGAMVYGQFIILGADDKDVAFFGLDYTEKFTNLNLDIVATGNDAYKNVDPKTLAEIKDLIENDHIKEMIVNGRFQELMNNPHIQKILAENRMDEIWTIAQSYSIYSYAHALVGTKEYPGYNERIRTLIENASSYPIPSQGFATSNFCNHDEECETKTCVTDSTSGVSRCMGKECTDNSQCKTDRCHLGTCIPKFGSCMECEQDTDCASNVCIESKCANMNGKMDNECNCKDDDSCQSGRCEGTNPSVCEAKLAIGQFCNEHSDCTSEYCNWLFHCSSGSVFSTHSRKRRDESISTSSSSSPVFAFGVIVVVAFAAFYGAKAYKRRTSGYKPIDSVEITV